jgi:glycosyltransferase involved in cell wall biosynthesis
MKNKILYVVSTLSQSGPTNQLYNILSHLDRELWKPIIVTLSPEPKGSQRRKFQDLNVDIVCLDLGRLSGAFYAKSKLKQVIEQVDPDLIHTQGIRADILVSAYNKRYNWLLTSRNFPIEDYPAKFGQVIGKYFVKIHTLAMRQCDNVISCSTSISNKLSSIGIQSETIHNGVKIQKRLSQSGVGKDVDLLKREIQSPIFITVGSLIPRKNVERLVEYFSSESVVSNASLIVVGDGSARSSLEASASGNIYFTGAIDNVSEYLLISDFYISASRSEGLPNTVMEALSCNLPCILSDIPSHREILSMASGAVKLFGLECNNLDLENTIYRDEPTFSNKARLTAQKYAENNFSAENMSMRYQNKYASMVIKK